jgi:hypothetical protein
MLRVMHATDLSTFNMNCPPTTNIRATETITCAQKVPQLLPPRQWRRHMVIQSSGPLMMNAMI